MIVVGAGITVVLPKKWSEGERRKLRRATVYEVAEWVRDRGHHIWWESGPLRGEVWENDEGVEWIHGHGDRARAALLAARAL